MPFLFIYLLASVFLFSCSISQEKGNIENVRFAVIGNTSGESPYSGIGVKINSVVNNINIDNPIFILHLGGTVCGGEKWQGITKIDIKRQYIEFRETISKLQPILYTVKGPTDLFKKSSYYYSKYTKRKDYYSFNYGRLHFIVLDSTNENLSVSEEQKQWLIEDLIIYKNSEAIFVFMSNPLFMPGKYKSLEAEIRYKEYKILHDYFKKYPVKAVFSGFSSFYYEMENEGILYINTGCGGFNRKDAYKKRNQYYLIDYKEGNICVSPKKMISQVSLFNFIDK